jgi:hypothetical protein
MKYATAVLVSVFLIISASVLAEGQVASDRKVLLLRVTPRRQP